MSGFKLIGIRPLIGTKQKYRKNLKEGCIFKFFNNYDFYDEQGVEILEENENLSSEISKLVCLENSVEGLFNTPKIELEISAIVGENGSGKSAIFQLMYVAFYSLTKKYNIPHSDTDIPGELKVLNNERFDLGELICGVNLELYFIDNDYLVIYQIKKSKIIFSIAQHLKKEGERHYSSFISDDFNKTYDISNSKKYQDLSLLKTNKLVFSLSNFFYTIGINYSIHGLNSKENSWLYELFHKNDGYQTPVVINPYRYEGQIDINNEYHLTQSRILLNAEVRNSSEILEGKYLKRIDFVFDPKRLSLIESTPLQFCLDEIIRENNAEKEDLYKLFTELYKGITGAEFNKSSSFKNKFIDTLFKFPDESIEDLSIYENLELYLAKYVIYKVLKLTINDRYLNALFGKRYLMRIGDEITGDDYIIHIFYFNRSEKNLVTELLNTNSHLTLKIKQTIYCIKNNVFASIKPKRIEGEKLMDIKFKYEMSFNKFKQSIKSWKSFNVKDEINLIPSSFAKVELMISSDNSDNFNYIELSSGEQQIVANLNTIYYHLYNLNSVHNTSNKVAYQNICILIDEVELYLHPEYQRKFINYLIQGLSKLKIRKLKSINIIFSTHSPFILSDIPSSNILRLENGKPSLNKFTRTFGANIHDLLANDFFLKNGFMGEFAKKKIDGIIQGLTIHINQKEIDKISKLNVGELPEYLKNKMEYLISEIEYIKKDGKAIVNKTEIDKLIPLIGEPVLRKKLEQMKTLEFGL